MEFNGLTMLQHHSSLELHPSKLCHNIIHQLFSQLLRKTVIRFSTILLYIKNMLALTTNKSDDGPRSDLKAREWPVAHKA